MMRAREIAAFVSGCARLAVRGGRASLVWMGFLLLLLVWGGGAYVNQLRHGLIVTNMRDQVSWAFYIGNFTFLVGVAAAAVVLVIPAYIYGWKPIKEVAILGEILAISAIVMCMLFVVVDMGRPDRFWHLIPGIGRINFPDSLLAWDVLVLNLYLVLNLVIVTHLLYCGMQGRYPNQRFVVPLVLFSIPAAVGIHTVTAFIYAGLAHTTARFRAQALMPRTGLRGFFLTGRDVCTAGVAGAMAVVLMKPILPYALAFAAGAMIYVVAEELIPSAREGEHSDFSTVGVMLGFAVMMTLDVALG